MKTLMRLGFIALFLMIVSLLFMVVAPVSVSACDDMDVPPDKCLYSELEAVPAYVRVTEQPNGKIEVDFAIEIFVCQPDDYQFHVYLHTPDGVLTNEGLWTKDVCWRWRGWQHVDHKIVFDKPTTRFMVGWSVGSGTWGTGNRLYETPDYQDQN